MRILFNDHRLPQRFWKKVRVQRDGCWVWIGGKGRKGYGLFYLGGYPNQRRTMSAHRWAYTCLVGPVPDGMTIDHICNNPPCVNAVHLRIASQQENILRGNGLAAQNAQKTHCPHGHPYDEQNTYWKPIEDGSRWGRICRICSRKSDRKYKARRRAVRA